MVEYGVDKDSAASVSHLSYEQLVDFLAEEGDLEAVLAETISKSKADKEMWDTRYEAMNALR